MWGVAAVCNVLDLSAVVRRGSMVVHLDTFAALEFKEDCKQVVMLSQQRRREREEGALRRVAGARSRGSDDTAKTFGRR